MLHRLPELVLILVTLALWLGVPGFALASLLRLRSVMSDSLLAATAGVLGLLPVVLTCALQLALHLPMSAAIAIHLGVTTVLVVAAIWRRRARLAGATVEAAAAPGLRWETIACLVGGVLLAIAVRGRVAFDTLYHASVARKLQDLPSPSFSNINRFADGGPNPAYFLPAWHELTAMVAAATHTDVLAVWEYLPAFTVLLGTLAAAGFGWTITRSRHGEALGAFAFLTMRVAFPRRRIDGDAVTYGNLPGFVVFDTVLIVLYAALALAIWHGSAAARKRALAVVGAATLVAIVLHANYVVYIALAGLGLVAWWLVRRPRRIEIAPHVWAAGVVTVVGAAAFGTLLPVLATLKHFGSPAENARLDYHLAGSGAMQHLRGGHLYETYGYLGLLVIVALPFVAWKWRSPRANIAWGSGLAMLLFGLVPPLYGILRATGSLTIGLRMNHALWPMMVGSLVCGAMLLAGPLERAWRRNLALRSLLMIAVLVLLGGGFEYHFRLADAPDLPGYFGGIGLIVVFLTLTIDSIRFSRSSVEPMQWRAPDPSRGSVLAVALLAVLVVLPWGLRSLRAVAGDARSWTVSVEADGLRCFAGDTRRELQKLPPAAVVLSDPKTSLDLMALAPVYVVGDYKVWNAETTDNNTAERLKQVNEFFDPTADDADRFRVIKHQHVDYLLLNTQSVEVSELSDDPVYDGASVLALVERNPKRFTELTDGHEADACHSYRLYRVND